MSGEKEIRTKIRSVKNMQKITKAMEMVAASKIRKAQAQMEASRPYAERIRRVIGHLAHANPDYKHPFLIEREAKRVGYIIIATDRGLCGGLNANMFKAVIGELQKTPGRQHGSRPVAGRCQGGAVFPSFGWQRGRHGDPSGRQATGQ